MCEQKTDIPFRGVEEPTREVLKTAVALVASLLGLIVLFRTNWLVPPSVAGGQAAADLQVVAENQEVPRPTWRVGDQWEIETVTRQIQDRYQTVQASPPIRWRFEVAAVEKRGGRNCFRIDADCMVKGRVRPRTTLWCDAETLMIREVQTQVASGGQYRTLHESYDSGAASTVPVLTSLNALPVDLPAFPTQVGKVTGKSVGRFTYTSQALPAGAKDPGIIRFTHEVEQNTTTAGPKVLELVASSFAKNLGNRPLIEVRLKTLQRSVVQLWQTGQPWPLYADNGRTVARLISTNHKP